MRREQFLRIPLPVRRSGRVEHITGLTAIRHRRYGERCRFAGGGSERQVDRRLLQALGEKITEHTLRQPTEEPGRCAESPESDRRVRGAAPREYPQPQCGVVLDRRLDNSVRDVLADHRDTTGASWSHGFPIGSGRHPVASRTWRVGRADAAGTPAAGAVMIAPSFVVAAAFFSSRPGIAPVMIATASAMVYSFAEMRSTRRPSR